MKYGQIYKKEYLSKLFLSQSHIIAVYSVKNFSFELDMIKLYILYDKSMNTALVFNALVNLYGNNVKLYISKNPDDLLFRDTVLIWKGGNWFV